MSSKLFIDDPGYVLYSIIQLGPFVSLRPLPQHEVFKHFFFNLLLCHIYCCSSNNDKHAFFTRWQQLCRQLHSAGGDNSYRNDSNCKHYVLASPLTISTIQLPAWTPSGAISSLI